MAAVAAAFAGVAVLAKEIKGMHDFCGHLAPLFGVFSRCQLPLTRRLKARLSVGDQGLDLIGLN